MYDKTSATESTRIMRLRSSSPWRVAMAGQTDAYLELQDSDRLWSEFDARRPATDDTDQS
jgi:hypothetical protein